MATDRPDVFANLLRQHRLEAGLTQASLAELAALSVRAVQNLEAGLGQPQRETARRLAAVLELTPDQREQFARAARPTPRTRTASASAAGQATPAGRRGSQPADDKGPARELTAERKRVTVLVADAFLTGPTSADLEPARADRILSSLLSRLVDFVHRYEGTVSQERRDGFTALFGAPIALEDHAVRGCYAAIAMRAAAQQIVEQADSECGTRYALRVGLDSGDVVVGPVHNDVHPEYAAIGPTVRVAARLAQLAGESAILLSGGTRRLVEGHVEARSIGPVSVGGLVEPVEIFELNGAGQPSSRFQVATARPLSGFIGREAELTALAQPLARARDGRGQVAAMIGEPGVGKSRLIYELLRSQALAGWTILIGGGISHGKDTPYLPLVGLLRAYFGIGSSDAIDRIREKVAGKVLQLDRTLAGALPALLALLDALASDPSASPSRAGLAFDSQAPAEREYRSAERHRSGPTPTPGQAAWAALDPIQRRQQTLDAIRRLLLRESQVQPLLVVLEDLHWIDSETQALLDALVASLPTAHVLLLVNYRPEYRHGWGNRGYYVQLRIDPLEADSAAGLLAGLVGHDASLEELKALLLRRTEGNPLFLEESVRALVETGALVGERGGYCLPRPISQVRVPGTVEAVLAARIDRLPPPEKALLQTAAVIGKDLPHALLRDVADADDEEFRHGLTALQVSEFLHEASLFPELEYTFKHALTHEVAYGSLLQERRRTLHRRVMEAIERLYADRLTEHVERLAYHSLRGEDWSKCVAYSRAAGQKAMAQSAYREAAASIEQAISALGQLVETRETLEHAIDLRLELRSALFALTRHGNVIEHLKAAEGLAELLGDRSRQGRVAAFLCISYGLFNDIGQGIEAGERALALAASLQDVPLMAVARTHLAGVHIRHGNYAPARELLGDNVEMLDGDRARERFGMVGYPSVISRSLLAGCLSEQGDFAQGIAHGRAGLEIARELGQAYSLGHVSMSLGGLYVRRGNHVKAIQVLEPAVEVFGRGDLQSVLGRATMILAHAYAVNGRAEDALGLAERALSARFPSSVGATEVFLLCGEVERAALAAQEALDGARGLKNHINEGWALLLLGEIATRRSADDEAESRYRESLMLAGRLGMRPLEAHCRLGLGKVFRRIGRLEEARAELSTAVAMLGAMGMAYWLPEAEGELAGFAR